MKLACEAASLPCWKKNQIASTLTEEREDGTHTASTTPFTFFVLHKKSRFLELVSETVKVPYPQRMIHAKWIWSAAIALLPDHGDRWAQWIQELETTDVLINTFPKVQQITRKRQWNN